jgi:hypothetical protein
VGSYKLSDQQFLASDFQLSLQLLAPVGETLAALMLLYDDSKLVLIEIEAEAEVQLE